MGGNAFDDTQRLSEEEYERIVNLVLAILGRKGYLAAAPPEIQDKAEIALGNFFKKHTPFYSI